MYNQIPKSTRSIPRKFRGKPFCPRNFLGIFKIPPTALQRLSNVYNISSEFIGFFRGILFSSVFRRNIPTK
ncbi:hypothetical protein BRARA_B01385 [Brassica rapa]|uniref:Uncharacterized protein n=1 Tax=Brassica campestris TaxID=3711 RepID=A0A398ABP6_BRACM|nr:hypothetical protein BRARA_B01385 [Brassica rapa]